MYVMTPILQISTGLPYDAPSKISGATYPGVPHVVTRPELSLVTVLANPKSASLILASSSADMSILDGVDEDLDEVARLFFRVKRFLHDAVEEFAAPHELRDEVIVVGLDEKLLKSHNVRVLHLLQDRNLELDGLVVLGRQLRPFNALDGELVLALLVDALAHDRVRPGANDFAQGVRVRHFPFAFSWMEEKVLGFCKVLIWVTTVIDEIQNSFYGFQVEGQRRAMIHSDCRAMHSVESVASTCGYRSINLTNAT
ncbi:hypothetical protein GQ600_23936 [Phytophthora cactorum]|nr:hypothetical protein GQ600_23936 [Phytophthora cactorum]